MSHVSIEKHLTHLIAQLIERLTVQDPTIREGQVSTVGPAPYRRLDCDGRALAYLRPRPRKRAVRVDVSGLWRVPRSSPLAVPISNGSAALEVTSEDDIEEAVELLRAAVTATRAETTARAA